MTTRPATPVFSPEAMTFLADLKANNDRAWFTAHRAVYERAIKAPAETFVAVMTPALEALAGGPIKAKIFRVHRDVRFSKDKSPYNAHLHIGFTPSANDDSGMFGFFFGLEPDRLHLGAGAFEFSGPALDRYRVAVAEEGSGRALARLLAKLSGAGLRIEGSALKRTPAPYPADHPRADLLRHKGVTVWREIVDRAVIEGPALFKTSLSTFREAAPLNRWIAKAVAP